MHHCGEIIIAINEQKHQGLLKLSNKSIKNNVELKLITSEKAFKLEPNLKILNDDFQVLFGPNTIFGGPNRVIESLEKELLS